MKFHYHFSNLLGTVYRQGDLVFSGDSSRVSACVGNKISMYDLRRHRAETLPVEGRTNFTRLALSPSGLLLIAADEEGQISVISLVSRSVLHTLRTHRPIRWLSFSPDGRYFVVAKESNAFVYRSPGPANREYNPFVLERVLKGAFDDVSCVAWSSCSRVVATGSDDTSVRIYALEDFENFQAYTLGGHTGPVRAVFFEQDSFSCYTVSQNGHLAIWECSIDPNDLKKKTRDRQTATKKRKEVEKEENSEDDIQNEEQSEEDKALSAAQEVEHKLYYKRLARHFLRDHLPQEDKRADVTAADFHQKNRILAACFSTGAFFIYELPDCTLLHSLMVSDKGISAVSISPAGDWIALGCQDHGQLVVWEWQSQSFVMKQQGHFNNMACLAYSPDGQHVATGGDDGKVKLWSASSGFSVVTFDKHTAAVEAMTFVPSGKVLLSASLDGSVRAFDMARYHNFRTFFAPRPAQFGCVAVDASGELVAAGGKDIFEIYLWSMKTGHALEKIDGHEGPVSSLAFSPSPSSSLLASASWDKTLRLWDAIPSGGSRSESFNLLSDATAVAFRPDGNEVAVATLNGQITFFDCRTTAQTGCIEGRSDLGSGRADSDLVTAKQSLKAKGFLALCYTADGSCVLAGGQSKHLCIYHVKEKLLVKKFEVTQNRSFDAMDDIVVSRKKMSEFGNLALVEDREDGGGQAIKLPGSRRGDLSSRALRPEVRVTGLQFSPTGRDFAAATTEGLLIYSLDTKLVFDPFELDEDVTPQAVRKALAKGEFAEGLLIALRLNENDVVREAIEQVPHNEIELICTDLPTKFVSCLVKFVGAEVQISRHLHFYALWSKHLLLQHGSYLRQNSVELMPALNLLHKNLLIKTKDVTAMCDRNVHTIQFLLTMAQMKRAAIRDLKTNEEDSDEEEEDNEDSDHLMADDDFPSNWEENGH